MAGTLRERVVVFVDISGSSRLYQQLGDGEAHRRVQRCLTLLQDVAGTMGGRVVKSTGDGLMCDFDAADTALLVAEAMQVAMDKESDGHDPKLGIHIGCHVGPVIETAGDLFGDTVNIAARVMDVARERQIVITRQTAERLNVVMRQNVRQLHGVHVKGRSDALTTLEYIWHRHGELTRPAAAGGAASAKLKVRFDGRELWLDWTGLSSINLGRGADCHIIVVDPEASRLHATIEARGDKFVVVDHSSNGTYVAGNGVAEICLKREELILPARGHIALGLSTKEDRATLVEFWHDTA